MTIQNLMIFAALLSSSAAFAQTAAPAAATGAASSASCPKPDAHPGRLASDNQRKGWGKEVNAWIACQKKIVADIQSQADEAVKTANAAVARSNAAVNEYNAAVNDLQAQSDAAVR